MEQYFWIDGRRNDELGITLQSPIEFSKPAPCVVSQHIPGKNGDLHYWDGSYENITGTAKCFALGNSPENAIMNINSLFLASPGYHRLEVSSEPGFFRLARIRKGPETNIRCNVLAPFSIEFDCMPQRWDVNGESVHTAHGGEYSNMSFNIVNPYQFLAKPLIRLSGFEGAAVEFPISLTISDSGFKNASAMSITKFASYIDIDAETQNVYSGETNMNNVVEAGLFPVLFPGENTITLTAPRPSILEGVTVEVTPRWWTL